MPAPSMLPFLLSVHSANGQIAVGVHEASSSIADEALSRGVNLCLLLQLQTFLILFFPNLLYLSVFPNTPAVLSPEVYHAFQLFFLRKQLLFSFLLSSPLLFFPPGSCFFFFPHCTWLSSVAPHVKSAEFKHFQGN